MFYIISNPRSGSSMLRLMLNSHPNIHVPPECGFMVWLYKKYKHANLNNKLILNSFIDDLIDSRKFEHWEIDQVILNEHFKHKKISSFYDLCLQIYKLNMSIQCQKKDVIGDKNNFYLNYINEIMDIDSSAKFIHLVRDGRDVACSYKEIYNSKIISKYKPTLPTKIEDIAHEWVLNLSTIRKSLNSLNNLIYIEIKYEELLTNTKKH